MSSPTPEQQKYRYRKRAALGLCPRCGNKPEPGWIRCRACRGAGMDEYYRNKDKRREYSRRYNKKLRDEAFAAYGGYRCACCQETKEEFLTLDHVNDDGAEHRRLIGATPQHLYRWLRRNGFPPIVRPLCMNCNFSFGMYGYCPHKKE